MKTPMSRRCGMMRMGTRGSSSGRWYLLSSGRTVWWGRSRVTRWPGWSFCSLGFFARRCATTGARVWLRLSGVIMRQYTEAVGRISGLHARVVRTWKFGALFRSGLVSDSYLFYVWVLPCGVQCIGLREVTLPGAQHLVGQWIHVMLLRRGLGT